MRSAIAITLKLLEETPNEAAVPVLIAALDAPDQAIQEGALRAVLARRSITGQRELLDRWDRLEQRLKDIILERPGRISAAVRDAVLSTDERLCHNGCDAAIQIREYDLIPALINSCEDDKNPFLQLHAETLLTLAEMLYVDCTDEDRGRHRRDPVLLRKHVVTALGSAMERYDRHRRVEIVESFLLLVERTDVVLNRILGRPRHASYLAVIDRLTNSSQPGIMELLLGYLGDNQAPHAPLNTIAHRTDMAFVKRLLDRVGVDPEKPLRLNLRRIEQVAWLATNLSRLESLDERQQQGAVQLAVASGMRRLEVFEVVKHILLRGHVAARRLAASALVEFSGVEANQLAMEGLNDADAEVQANLVRQLRGRGIPGAITKLIELVDSPLPIVRDAAKESLSEFNFQRFLGAFDMLDDEVRRSTGRLVRRIDPSVTLELAGELKSGTRTRRLRGLEMAVAMDMVADVEPLVIGLISDEDHFVRAEAARALGYCHTPMARAALREALLDRSVAVQEAAEMSLQMYLERQQAQDNPAPRPPTLTQLARWADSTTDRTHDAGSEETV